MWMSVALAFGALFGLATAAAAQNAAPSAPSAPCSCKLADHGVATVQDAGGLVLVTGSRGYEPVGPGAELTIGDRIVLMNDGRAVIEMGAGCRVELTAPALASFVAHDNGACLARQELDVTVEPAQAPPGTGGQAPYQPTGTTRLSDAGFFADLGAFLGTKGVADSVRARNLDEVLPVSP